MIENFKERFLYAMELRDKRQADLKKDLNISSALISQWANGKVQRMSTENLYRVAKYLNVNETWLMGYDTPMERGAVNTEKTIAQYNINRYVEHELANNEIEQIVKMLQESTPEQVHKIYETTKIFLDK